MSDSANTERLVALSAEIQQLKDENEELKKQLQTKSESIGTSATTASKQEENTKVESEVQSKKD